MPPLPLLLGTALALALAFAAVYALARRLDNYGIVDIAWAYSFGPVALGYAALADGWAPRRWLIASLVLAWSLRLGTHLYRRVMGHHPVEDGRYQAMRQQWGARLPWKMFGFFQAQALTVVVLALPFLLAALNPAPALHPLEYASAGLWLAALAGEAVADAQLAAFRRDPARTGAVCTIGLWRYSRHPNYFCEWLVWLAYAGFALTAPWGALGLVSPLAILYLLLRVTGIPPTEAQALRRRGEAYRRYQQTTSAFVPWWTKRSSP